MAAYPAGHPDNSYGYHQEENTDPYYHDDYQEEVYDDHRGYAEGQYDHHQTAGDAYDES